MQAIKTTQLVKQYKNLTAVDKLDLEIQQGELFSLLGVNGAGKTTTIKMLSCLTAPTDGDAIVGGHSIIKETKQVKQLIGVSPQETAVAPNLSVEENLELICGIHEFTKEKTQEKIQELSKQFALDTVLKRKAGKLSGGWQRRVSIAMALISEPQILFLDEPTLGLDVIARHELWETIRLLKGKITIILTTHYMEEAAALSDRIGIMKMMTFAKRCTKEILRDPINLGFGLGFPLVLLVLLSAIQSSVPVSLFEIDTLTPGITVFGLSFMTLFSATLIAKDRESALLQRLYTTPLTGLDFILGYMLPILPIAIGQTVICYLFAIPLGLTMKYKLIIATNAEEEIIAILIHGSALYISYWGTYLLNGWLEWGSTPILVFPLFLFLVISLSG